MTDVSIPILLAVIGMLIVVLALAVVARQLVVSRQRGAFECSIHRRSLVGGSSWQHVLMRFGTDRLRWFRAFKSEEHTSELQSRGHRVGRLQPDNKKLPSRAGLPHPR